MNELSHFSDLNHWQLLSVGFVVLAVAVLLTTILRLGMLIMMFFPVALIGLVWSLRCIYTAWEGMESPKVPSSLDWYFKKLEDGTWLSALKGWKSNQHNFKEPQSAPVKSNGVNILNPGKVPTSATPYVEEEEEKTEQEEE